VGSGLRNGGHLTLQALYPPVLFAHSWLRWIVLVLGLVVLARTWRSWRTSTPPMDPRLRRSFVIALDAQFVLGLVMYVVLSPITRTAFSDMGAAMGITMLRFFSVEHVFGMTVAVIAAHIGHAVSGRISADDEADRRGLRAPFVAQSVWLVATLASIPWQGLPYGRPLFRLAFPG